VVVLPSGVYIDLSIRLEFAYTNNQVEYESLLRGFEFLRDLGARDVDVFRHSNLIVQQIKGIANAWMGCSIHSGIDSYILLNCLTRLVLSIFLRRRIVGQTC
jgi:ribonuclease HI